MITEQRKTALYMRLRADDGNVNESDISFINEK